MELVARHTEKIWQGHRGGGGKAITAIWKSSCRGGRDHELEGYRRITEGTRGARTEQEAGGGMRNSITPAMYLNGKPPKSPV